MSDRPDILWLSLESVRASNTPMYGYNRDTTPNLRELGEESSADVLDNGIAQSLWTPASSASMLTGTYLSTHQVGQSSDVDLKLTDDLDTLPELLRNIGYETALVTPNPYLSESTGLDRGFDRAKIVQAVPHSYSPFHSDALQYWSEGLKRLVRSRTANVSRMKNELKTTENDLVERFSKNYLNELGNDESPFFFYAHIPGAHHPYLPNKDYLQSFTDDIELSAEEAFSLVKRIYYGDDNEIKRHIANGLDFSREEWAGIEAMYDATLRQMDHTAGELIDCARSVSDDLVIVITGDHGELFGERGVLGHNLVLHDEVIKVPMIVDGVPDIHTNLSAHTQQIDLTYTIGKLTGISLDQFEGRDIRNRARPYAISQRGNVVLESYKKYNPEFDTTRFFESPHTCIRTNEYKLLENNTRVELYNLPDEEADISHSNQDKVDELKSKIESEDIIWTTQVVETQAEFDESQKSQLKDLGYLS